MIASWSPECAFEDHCCRHGRIGISFLLREGEPRWSLKESYESHTAEEKFVYDYIQDYLMDRGYLYVNTDEEADTIVEALKIFPAVIGVQKITRV